MGLVFLNLTLVGLCLILPFLGSHGNLLYGLLTTKDHPHTGHFQVQEEEVVTWAVGRLPLYTALASGGSQSAADLSVEIYHDVMMM